MLLADPFGVAVVWESIYSKVTSAESFRRHRSNLTKNESVIGVRYYSSVFAALARRCTREGRIPHCTRWTCVSYILQISNKISSKFKLQVACNEDQRQDNNNNNNNKNKSPSCHRPSHDHLLTELFLLRVTKLEPTCFDKDEDE